MDKRGRLPGKVRPRTAVFSHLHVPLSIPLLLLLSSSSFPLPPPPLLLSSPPLLLSSLLLLSSPLLSLPCPSLSLSLYCQALCPLDPLSTELFVKDAHPVESVRPSPVNAHHSRALGGGIVESRFCWVFLQQPFVYFFLLFLCRSGSSDSSPESLRAALKICATCSQNTTQSNRPVPSLILSPRS